MSELLDRAVAGYSGAKTWIISESGMGEDLLHVHVGLLIFVLAALVLRKKMRSPIPLALVVLFALLNEVIDWLVEPPQALLEPVVDVANTVFWPTVLFLLARRWK